MRRRAANHKLHSLGRLDRAHNRRSQWQFGAPRSVLEAASCPSVCLSVYLAPLLLVPRLAGAPNTRLARGSGGLEPFGQAQLAVVQLGRFGPEWPPAHAWPVRQMHGTRTALCTVHCALYTVHCTLYTTAGHQLHSPARAYNSARPATLALYWRNSQGQTLKKASKKQTDTDTDGTLSRPDTHTDTCTQQAPFALQSASSTSATTSKSATRTPRLYALCCTVGHSYRLYYKKVTTERLKIVSRATLCTNLTRAKWQQTLWDRLTPQARKCPPARRPFRSAPARRLQQNDHRRTNGSTSSST